MSGVEIQPGHPLILKDRETGYTATTFPEDELRFDTSEIERRVTVIDRNRKIVEEVSKYIKEDQKTLVFAINDEHADQLEKLFRERYSYIGDRFVQKITYKVVVSNSIGYEPVHTRDKAYPDVIHFSFDVLRNLVEIQRSNFQRNKKLLTPFDVINIIEKAIKNDILEITPEYALDSFK